MRIHFHFHGHHSCHEPTLRFVGLARIGPSLKERPRMCFRWLSFRALDKALVRLALLGLDNCGASTSTLTQWAFAH